MDSFRREFSESRFLDDSVILVLLVACVPVQFQTEMIYDNVPRQGEL